ncbi:hypothetical protein BDV93DRAFT_531076 [Ceratobasidium sp. AG-I]|nr:hypothetical protein BDV93DRAFT_531076 [Ceratobasidium sp. AG-I]
MVALAALSTIALMIASGVLAAPWEHTSRHATHSTRGVGPTGVKLTSYHPPSTFEGYGVDGISHPLSKRDPTKRASPEDAAKSFLQDKLGVAPDGLSRFSGHSFDGMSYHYFSQDINGIPIANAVANVAMKGDQVMSYGASFVKPKSVSSASPVIALLKAISIAEQKLGGKYNKWPAELKYFAKDDGNVVLTHVVQIQNVQTSIWKQAYIDAKTGDLVNVVDFVADASYHVVPLLYQDPTQKYEVVSNPAGEASPNGWHFLEGKSTNSTAGNNINAYKGIDKNQIPINNSLTTQQTPQSSSPDNYIYPYDPAKEPIDPQNVHAATVNAFYVANLLHDITSLYGFNEASFNFQQDNFGKGGKGNDPVQISVQDPSGVNNANFATPPDGQSGQMRMFLWTSTKPLRDGALENDIVTHEYTHGISNRLTGGGTGTCLQTTEAGGMGEGWSDAVADITEAKTNPLKDFTLGSYVTNNPAGIRSYPYSTDKNTNPLTYASLAGREEVHAIGEVWANMFHEILGALIAKKDLSSDLKDSKASGGNTITLQLILDAFKLQPCNPTFISARDAIIQADENKYGGTHKCLLWKAFAKRGLGNGATAEKVDNNAIPSDC